jgi:hypothetical protein
LETKTEYNFVLFYSRLMKPRRVVLHIMEDACIKT